ncbi:MAG: Uma2 family endonuclease [Planctomycetota bacterium]
MATALETTLLTAEEFLHLDDGGAYTELVRGRIVEMNRPYTAHGYFMIRIGFLFQQFIQEHDLGRIVGGDAGVVTERDPDTVRGPDVAFYSYERIPRGPLPEGYWPAAPELVVEIRSHDDRWKDILHKASEYLSAGVLTVAVADPATQRVHLFSADRETTVLNLDDELTFPDILPGFHVPVSRLFE